MRFWPWLDKHEQRLLDVLTNSNAQGVAVWNLFAACAGSLLDGEKADLSGRWHRLSLAAAAAQISPRSPAVQMFLQQEANRFLSQLPSTTSDTADFALRTASFKTCRSEAARVVRRP
jgi:hypothetical protein